MTPTNGSTVGCDLCRHPVFCGTQCNHCGRVIEPAQEPDWLVLAQQCGGTVYRHRSDPHKPGVAFGDESWARFTEALSKLTLGVEGKS